MKIGPLTPLARSQFIKRGTKKKKKKINSNKNKDLITDTKLFPNFLSFPDVKP